MPELIIWGGYLAILCAAGVVSDHILRHIEPINQFINRLPMMMDYGNGLDLETYIFGEEKVV